MKCKEDKFRIVTLPDPEVGKEVLEEDTLNDYDKDQEDTEGTSNEDAKMHVRQRKCSFSSSLCRNCHRLFPESSVVRMESGRIS